MSMFRRNKRPSSAIDLAPLVDVVFLLLIFFMLTSSFAEPSLPLTLPQSKNTEGATTQPVVVSLDAAGQLAINGEEISMAEYEQTLRAALERNGVETVNFRGDESVDYGEFLRLMDVSRAAGAVEFHLIHSPGQ
ncbi:MAG: ExbD/TolR family protein [Verrucomicrobiales bacterium]